MSYGGGGGWVPPGFYPPNQGIGLPPMQQPVYTPQQGGEYLVAYPHLGVPYNYAQHGYNVGYQATDTLAHGQPSQMTSLMTHQTSVYSTSSVPVPAAQQQEPAKKGSKSPVVPGKARKSHENSHDSRSSPRQRSPTPEDRPKKASKSPVVPKKARKSHERSRERSHDSRSSPRRRSPTPEDRPIRRSAVTRRSGSSPQEDRYRQRRSSSGSPDRPYSRERQQRGKSPETEEENYQKNRERESKPSEETRQKSKAGHAGVDIQSLLTNKKLRNVVLAGLSKATAKLGQSRTQDEAKATFEKNYKKGRKNESMSSKQVACESRPDIAGVDLQSLLQNEKLKKVVLAGVSKATAKLEQSRKQVEAKATFEKDYEKSRKNESKLSKQVPHESRPDPVGVDLQSLLQNEKLKNVLLAGVSKATAKLEQSMTEDETKDIHTFLRGSSKEVKAQLSLPASTSGVSVKSHQKSHPSLKGKADLDGRGDAQAVLTKLSTLEKAMQMLRGKADSLQSPSGSSHEQPRSTAASNSHGALRQRISSHNDNSEGAYLYGDIKPSPAKKKKTVSGTHLSLSESVFADSKEEISEGPDKFEMKDKLFEKWRQSHLTSSKTQKTGRKDSSRAGDQMYGREARPVASSLPLQEKQDESQEELDSTLQNVLQSIGFDFGLSQRMQQLAQEKKTLEEEKISGILNKSASFLGKGSFLAEELRTTLLQSDNIKKNLLREAKSRIYLERSGKRKGRSPSPLTRRGKSPESEDLDDLLIDSPDQSHQNGEPKRLSSSLKDETSSSRDSRFLKARQGGSSLPVSENLDIAKDKYVHGEKDPLKAPPEFHRSRSLQGGQKRSGSPKSVSTFDEGKIRSSRLEAGQKSPARKRLSPPSLSSESPDRSSDYRKSARRRESVSPPARRRLSGSRRSSSSISSSSKHRQQSRSRDSRSKSPRRYRSRSPIRHRSRSPRRRPRHRRSSYSRSPRRRSSPLRSSHRRLSSRSRRRRSSPSRSPPRRSSHSRPSRRRSSSSRSRRRRSSPSKSPPRHTSPLRALPRHTSPLRSPPRYTSPLRSLPRYISPLRSLHHYTSPLKERGRSLSRMSPEKKDSHKRDSKTSDDKKVTSDGKKDTDAKVKKEGQPQTEFAKNMDDETKSQLKKGLIENEAASKEVETQKKDKKAELVTKLALVSAADKLEVSDDIKSCFSRIMLLKVEKTKLKKRQKELQLIVQQKGRGKEDTEMTVIDRRLLEILTEMKSLAAKSLGKEVGEISQEELDKMSKVIGISSEASEDVQPLATQDKIVSKKRRSSDVVTVPVSTSKSKKSVELKPQPTNAARTDTSGKKKSITPVPKTKSVTPVTKIATPVTKTATPVTKTATPVTKSATPVTKTATPVTKSATLVTKKAVPVTKKATAVTKSAAPVIETATPVTKSATIVTKTATPVTKSATPVTKTATPVKITYVTKIVSPVTKDGKKKAPAPSESGNKSRTSADDRDKMLATAGGATSKKSAKAQNTGTSNTAVKTAPMKKNKVAYEYIDGGNHVCHHCHVTCKTLRQFFAHYHGTKHAVAISKVPKPWDEPKVPKQKNRRGGQAQIRKIKGSDDIIPVTGFYCSSCQVFCGDFRATENHLMSDSHYDKYLSKGETSQRSPPLPPPNPLSGNQCICPACDKTFGCRQDLAKHISLFHLKITQHACPVCDKCFSKKANLMLHLMLHSEMVNAPTSSDDSSASLSTLSTTHPISENRHSCPVCGQTFAKTEILTQHISAFHLKIKQHPCPMCHKCFNRKTSLMKHMKLHKQGDNASPSSEAPAGTAVSLERKRDSALLSYPQPAVEDKHLCTVCEETFSDESSLSQHVCTVHSGKGHADFEADLEPKQQKSEDSQNEDLMPDKPNCEKDLPFEQVTSHPTNILERLSSSGQTRQEEGGQGTGIRRREVKEEKDLGATYLNRAFDMEQNREAGVFDMEQNKEAGAFDMEQEKEKGVEDMDVSRGVTEMKTEAFPVSQSAMADALQNEEDEGQLEDSFFQSASRQDADGQASLVERERITVTSSPSSIDSCKVVVPASHPPGSPGPDQGCISSLKFGMEESAEEKEREAMEEEKGKLGTDVNSEEKMLLATFQRTSPSLQSPSTVTDEMIDEVGKEDVEMKDEDENVTDVTNDEVGFEEEKDEIIADVTNDEVGFEEDKDEIVADVTIDKVGFEEDKDEIIADVTIDKVGFEEETDEITADVTIDEVVFEEDKDEIIAEVTIDKVGFEEDKDDIVADVTIDNVGLEEDKDEIVADVTIDEVGFEEDKDEIVAGVTIDEVGFEEDKDEIIADVTIDKVGFEEDKDEIVADVTIDKVGFEEDKDEIIADVTIDKVGFEEEKDEIIADVTIDKVGFEEDKDEIIADVTIDKVGFEEEKDEIIADVTIDKVGFEEDKDEIIADVTIDKVGFEEDKDEIVADVTIDKVGFEEDKDEIIADVTIDKVGFEEDKDEIVADVTIDKVGFEEDKDEIVADVTVDEVGIEVDAEKKDEDQIVANVTNDEVGTEEDAEKEDEDQIVTNINDEVKIEEVAEMKDEIVTNVTNAEVGSEEVAEMKDEDEIVTDVTNDEVGIEEEAEMKNEDEIVTNVTKADVGIEHVAAMKDKDEIITNVTNDEVGTGEVAEIKDEIVTDATDDEVGIEEDDDEIAADVTNDEVGIEEDEDEIVTDVTNDEVGTEEDDDEIAADVTNDEVGIEMEDDETEADVSNDEDGFEEDDDETEADVTSDEDGIDEDGEEIESDVTNDEDGFEEDAEDEEEIVTDGTNDEADIEEDVEVKEEEEIVTDVTDDEVGIEEDVEVKGEDEIVEDVTFGGEGNLKREVTAAKELSGEGESSTTADGQDQNPSIATTNRISKFNTISTISVVAPSNRERRERPQDFRSVTMSMVQPWQPPIKKQ